MIQQVEQRLKELKNEFEAGQKTLAELETRQANVKSTLLRISGAIQVLTELLEKDASETQNGSHVPESATSGA